MGTAPRNLRVVVTPDSVDGQALLHAARAEYSSGSVHSAWTAIQKAVSVGRRTGDSQLLIDAALVITSAPTGGSWELTAQRHALCQEALALVDQHDHELISRLQALLVVTRNPWATGADLVRRPTEDHPEEFASANLHARYSAAVGASGVQTRLDCAAELAGLARTGRHDEDSAWTSIWRLEAYYQLGKRLELNAEMMKLVAVVGTLKSPVWQWRLAAARVSLAAVDGHLADLPALMAQALRLGQLAGLEEAPYLDLVMRSSLAVQIGSGLTEVETEVRRALDGAPFFAHGWHARVLLAMGRVDEAVSIWRALAPMLPDFPVDSREWLVATAGNAELCSAADDIEAAKFLTDQLTPFADHHVVGGIVTPYEGPVRLYLGKLAVVLGDRSAAREHFGAAVRSSEHMHAPLYTSQARRCLAELADSASPLTSREMDVARLAAAGLTNRQIADRFVLSERTVENHVSSVLRKLGIATRSAIGRHLPDSR